MTYNQIFYDKNPEPGKVLDELTKKILEGDLDNIPKVETIKEQKERANNRLDKYLRNLSDSPGARKVVEEFYQDYHEIEIDASEYEELKKVVPDVDSIINGDSLPVLSKNDLRHRFDVEGINKNGKPTLIPEWVRKHRNEPYLKTETSGTTGEPWGRAFTRNDWAFGVTHYFRIFNDMISDAELSPTNINAAVIFPPDSAISALVEVLNGLGVEVMLADFKKLRTGGDAGIKEGERIVEHVNSGNEGMIVSCLEMIMNSKLGVSIRREELDASLFVNAGNHISEATRDTLESKGEVENIFGETEYPQGGGRWREIDGEAGFDLPFDSQINLVYNKETEEINYEGEGRLAYFMYSSEGHIVPGIYVSGVTGKIEMVGNKHQLVSNIERVQDPDRGCYEELFF